MQEQQKGEMVRSSKSIERLRYDAGSISLDLQATLGRRLGEPVERLYSTSRLNEWLLREGLINQPLALDDTHLVRVRLFRELLYRMTRSVLEHASSLPSDVEELNLVARTVIPPPQIYLNPQQSSRFLRHYAFAPSLDSALAVVARDAIELLTGDRASLLHMCESHDCAMIFIDSSRGQRRHWCSNNRCGNKARVAAHRAKYRVGQP